MNLCLICHDLLWLEKHAVGPSKFLCAPCFGILFRLKQSKPIFPPLLNQEVNTLYRYEGPIRELILRAKVRNDYRALQLLKHIVSTEHEWLSLARHAQAIIPAPSSLWGRLRGRFDVADSLARKLSMRTQTPILKPPFSLLWRVKKRAKKRNKESLPSFPELPQIQPISHNNAHKGPYYLILDDIVTTGLTLYELKRALPDKSLKFLGFASKTF